MKYLFLIFVLMLTHKTIEHANLWANQLSLDFPNSPEASRAHIANRIYAITSKDSSSCIINPHFEKSNIHENKFSFYFSYKGRSYLFKWSFHKKEVINFSERDSSYAQIHIDENLHAFFGCRNTHIYDVPTIFSATERKAIKEKVYDLIQTMNSEIVSPY